MKKKRNIIITSALISLLIIFAFIIIRNSYSINENKSVNEITIGRINEIRSTTNTDVSKVSGRIFYVSNSGDDNNDGLSEETPWKTLTKVNQMMSNKTVKNGDAILFNRGDLFRGNIALKDNNITLGSYGNTSLAKPKLYGSSVDAAKEGEWVEVYPNYWKYTLNGTDAIFKNDVGEIWFFCNEGNDNCDRTTTDGQIHYVVSQKTMTYSNVEENEDSIAGVLNKDLQFYHVGHAYNSTTTGKEIYVYSTSNPAERFDEIEISLGLNGIGVGSYNDIVIDNLQVSFYGRHGVGAGSVSNLSVTNSEFSFIGGMVQSYNQDAFWPLRFGNAIEVYGSIAAKTNYPVKDGFVIQNNYIYEIYDAGMTFQYTGGAGKSGQIERAVFDNNVVEYCSYNIEYWMRTDEKNDTSKTNNTYLNKVYFTNNILRYAGIGFTETRPEHGYEALIKTWDSASDTLNVLKDDGEFLIENNIFDTTGQLNDNQGNPVGTWMLHITASNSASLPTIRNNKFYNYSTKNLGYVTANDLYRNLIPYNEQLQYNESLLKNNEFTVYDKTPEPNGTYSGVSNEVNWTLDLNNRTLTLSGAGRMEDYFEGNEAPWNQYKDYISDIIIGEDITYLGRRAFYELAYVQNIYFNAKNMESLASNNDTFYNVGKKSTGTKLIIGEEVTKIPSHLTNPHWVSQTAPYITQLEIKGNKLTTIDSYALPFIYVEELILPDSITTLNTGALYKNPALKVVKIPSNITNISNDLLKGCKNLETVILGSATTSIGANALIDLPNLSRIVVPNENFVFNTTDTIINNMSPYGMQLFGITSVGTIATEYQYYEENSMAIYSIPMSKYKPLIYGDSKNFYAIYENSSYGANVTYTAKALSNSNVTITNAKYRYIDRFKHKHLIDGVNIDLSTNTINNVFMDIELVGTTSNKDERIIDNQNVLFLGNSFLKGFGDHGMAAFDTKNDYYYYVMQYLKSLNPNINSYKVSVNPWEETTSQETRTSALNNIINEYNNNINSNINVGTIFIQLGENINSDERRATFEEDYNTLIQRFKSEYPNAKIYALLGKGNNSQNQNIIKNICNINDIEVIEFVRLEDRYRAYMGEKYYSWSNATSFITNEGIAWHPSNYGFVNIADNIIDYLKNNNYGRIPTISSDKYNISNRVIYLRPTTNKIYKEELINNISATDNYKVYHNNKEVLPNGYLPTSSRITMLNVNYDVVVIGDVTGDGQITLGDIAKLYNYYKNNVELNDYFLEAGKISGDNVSLNDINKLYNFYKGKTNLEVNHED